MAGRTVDPVRTRVTLILLSIMALVLGTALVAPGAANASTPKAGWYLALGDSLAAGYQPGQGDDKTGGYVGQVAASLQAPLTNLACSGETTSSYLGKTANRCYPGSSQEAAAVAFLDAHAGTAGVITIDVGANDIDGCVPGGQLDLKCIGNGLGTVGTNLPAILSTLRQHAPTSRIVVLNYYNPFLAAYLQSSTRTVAILSMPLANVLNGIIGISAASVGGRTANVAGIFQSDNIWTRTTLPGVGSVPTNVALICSWTWMCVRGDIHANDTGYTKLATAVQQQLR